MIFDYENKIINLKIVYYGPAMSGKTTSLKYLFTYFNKEIESIDNSVGRTLFFDFGTLEFEGAEWNIKFLIYSATGQDFYASTRPATLIGTGKSKTITTKCGNRIAHAANIPRIAPEAPTIGSAGKNFIVARII